MSMYDRDWYREQSNGTDNNQNGSGNYTKMSTFPAKCTSCGYAFNVRVQQPNPYGWRDYTIHYQCPRCGERFSITRKGQEKDHRPTRQAGDKIAKAILFIIGVACVILIALSIILRIIYGTPVLQTLSMAYERTSSFLYQNTDIQALLTLLPKLFVLFVCFPVHECAHAWMAYKLGDSTGKQQGRLSLNPFRHLDLVGSLMILLVGIGYAKPVQVNPRNFKNKKRDMAFTALAGPLSNLMMALAVLVIFKITVLKGLNLNADLIRVMIYIAYINISLVIFNLLPIPPLDGSKVLGVLLPDGEYDGFVSNGRMLTGVLLIAIMASNMMGYSPISILTEKVFWLLYHVIIG